MLGALDPLPRRPDRVLVAGVSGAGKSTLARRIAGMIDAPYQEIDALHWGSEWTPRSGFRDDVLEFTAAPRWVTEWQYRGVRALLAERADLLVWLDLPRRIALARVIRRTVRRRLTREPLWNGNVEPPLHTFITDRDHIVRFALRTHAGYPPLIGRAEAAYPQLAVVRLTSPSEVERWLAGPLAEHRTQA